MNGYAFSSSEILVPGVGEIQIADHLVFLDEHTLLFQLKERDSEASRSQDAVKAWFERKIRKVGVTQLKNTLAYLEEHAGTRLENDRGHLIELPNPERERLSAIVVYDLPETLKLHLSRGYQSRRAGFVHFIDANDYFEICHLLVTPTEIIGYLRYRESMIKQHSTATAGVTELALIAQFMLEAPGAPNERYSSALGALRGNREQWDISFITNRLGDQIVFRKGDQSATSHYRILSELGKLSRAELSTMKERLLLCLKAVQEDRLELPYRLAVPRIDCGFLLMPLVADQRANAEDRLTSLCLGSKYELKTTKHIGLALTKEGAYIDILWAYMDSPVHPDPELDGLLRASYPFRRTASKLIHRYQFDTDELQKSLGDPEGGRECALQ